MSYFNEIECYFLSKTGRASPLSPQDWNLLRSWKERQIPTSVVFRTIDKALEANQGKISTLKYLEQAVGREFTLYCNTHIGQSAPVTTAGNNNSHLERLREQVIKAPAKMVYAEQIIGWLQAQLAELTTDSELETALPNLCEQLNKRLLCAPAELFAACKKQVDERLASNRQTFSESAYLRTHHKLLIGCLRNKLAIPELYR